MHIIGTHILGQGIAYLEGRNGRPALHSQIATTYSFSPSLSIPLAQEHNPLVAKIFEPRTPSTAPRSAKYLITPEIYTQLDYMLTKTGRLSTVSGTRTFSFQEWDTNHCLFAAQIEARLGAKNPHSMPLSKLQCKMECDSQQEWANNEYTDYIQTLLQGNQFAPLAGESDPPQAVDVRMCSISVSMLRSTIKKFPPV